VDCVTQICRHDVLRQQRDSLAARCMPWPGFSTRTIQPGPGFVTSRAFAPLPTIESNGVPSNASPQIDYPQVAMASGADQIAQVSPVHGGDSPRRNAAHDRQIADSTENHRSPPTGRPQQVGL